MEHPFYYDTVWDLWRLIDVLEKRPDVDPKRIGMLGHLDGRHPDVAGRDASTSGWPSPLPLIAVQSFRWSLDNDKWQGRANTIKAAHEAAAKDLGDPMVNQKVCRALWGKVIPGILDEFDCPNMLRLFAGRPLLHRQRRRSTRTARSRGPALPSGRPRPPTRRPRRRTSSKCRLPRASATRSPTTRRPRPWPGARSG